MLDLEFNKNDDKMRLLISEMKRRHSKVALGGGKKKIDKQHEKGKLTARERIDYLKDSNADFFEIGAFAGYEMYDEYGGCPSGGVVAGITYIKDKQCVVVANDATVKAGAWFPITAKKNLRLQEIAMENRLPIIYLVDSAGVFLPMQDEIFPDKEHFGRIFRNNAKMSSMGITQISAIMGSCVAGGAYLPIMSDEALIVDKTASIFLAGSYLVKAAIGEVIDNETLGGATTHCEISGVTDYKSKDDKDALDKIKSIMDKIGEFDKAGFNRKEPEPPVKEEREIYGIVPRDRTKPYEIKDIIERLVDKSEFDEYKKEYGKSIVCGYARVDGWSVGIVANQRERIKSKKGELQLGGVIYSDSADKAARFIANCNQKKIPLVFLQDVTGFMVGSRSEHGGIIKDGAKMVNSMSNSVVPKFTIIMGNSYGAGNYAMCGRSFNPRFLFSYPNSKSGVMGAEQLAGVMEIVKRRSSQSLNKKIDEKLLQEEKKKLADQADKKASVWHTTSEVWDDGVIDPRDTRKYLSLCLAAVYKSEIKGSNSFGVFRM